MNKNTENIVSVDSLSIATTGIAAISIVKDLNFHIEENKVTALLGKSGSGKTLTALSLTGLLGYLDGLEAEGNISFDGVDGNILKLDEAKLKGYRGRTISMISQDPYSSFDPLKKCGVQLMEVLKSNGIEIKSTPKDYILDLFMQLGVETRLFNSYPHFLSGGQLQRLNIIASLIPKPKMIVADEPTTNLDYELKKDVLDLLLKVKKEFGVTILYISHDLDAIRYIADNIIYIEDGKLVDQLSKIEFFSKYRPGFSRMYKIDKINAVSGDMSTSKLKILEVRNVKKIFSNNELVLFGKSVETIALDGVSFDVMRGDIFGIIGESGSGKSTLARVILNLVSKDSGEIIFNGTIEKSDGGSIYNVVQIVFQNPLSALNPALKIKILLKEAIIANKNRKHTVGSIEKELEYILDIVRLPKSILDKRSSQLSGGEGQRVAIARALAVKPHLIVFDESISSLDRDMQMDILDLLLRLKKELGLTYIFISHDLKVCSMFCNKVLVLHKGKVVECGSVSDIFNSPKHEYTKQLLDSVLI